MPENIGHSEKIIVGGGITGLVWKFYNPDFHIISPDIGGFFAKSHLLWLHDTAETRKLLTDLGWKHPEQFAKRSYIGYMADGWIADYQTDWLNAKIIQRKMTPWNEDPDPKFTPKTKDLSLSTVGNYNYMNTLGVDLEEVIERLNKNANIENGFVTKITPTHIETKKNFKDETAITIPYDTLITSIAAPLFWKAYGNEELKFKSMPITNVIVDSCPPMFDNEYEMVYYACSYPFSRISHLQNSWSIEFTGEITKEQFEKLYPEMKIKDIFVIKHGRIWENDKHKSPQENIIFSGRFSQWEYGIVTESIIKQVIEHKETK